ncbi:DhnA family fructose-bisphosphate aldolase class Ia [Alkalihalobacillus xiaoxiensis]|uniref:DhnA family fructose-bisphosphate aldolase class Ia n=1 Tax=Shouchella xiaoxiensis TaxID=766895 RepID=A0ABS2T069_9BACI|nr:hypothetical protein [Shouchella xiaoxiensis]MBM7840841.1 DhnA family fructose-bisphosphate aldolase class Ia [Shouchella xiaoxiensis]
MTKNRRMNRIFAEDGKSITLALDGGYFSTKTEGIDSTIALMPRLIENGLDAVLVTQGMAKTYAASFSRIAMLVRADMSAAIFDASVPATMACLSVEEAARIGADGIISMTFPGAQNEMESHAIASALARDAERWNMPYMCETLPYGYAVTTEDSAKASVIATAAQIGAELGADIIKTRFSGKQEDALIVELANRPVLALGGPKTEDMEAYFSFVKHCLDVGASGVAVGRNITQNPHPVGVVAGLNVLIHLGGSVNEACEAYQA